MLWYSSKQRSSLHLISTILAERSIKTIREAKNILNLLYYNLSILEKEVEFWDMLGVCILHYHYPQIFDSLSRLEDPFYQNRTHILTHKITEDTFVEIEKKYGLPKFDPVYHYLKTFEDYNSVNRDSIKKESTHYKNTIYLTKNHGKYFSLLKHIENRTRYITIAEQLNLTDHVVISHKSMDINT